MVKTKSHRRLSATRVQEARYWATVVPITLYDHTRIRRIVSTLTCRWQVESATAFVPRGLPGLALALASPSAALLGKDFLRRPPAAAAAAAAGSEARGGRRGVTSVELDTGSTLGTQCEVRHCC